MKKSVAILGGDGFIGRYLVKCLVESGEYYVTSFSNYFDPGFHHYDDVEYKLGDFFKEEDIENVVRNSDMIVHAICSINPGNSNEKKLFAYTHDLIYTIKLCELCIKYKKRLVFISSGGTVYGNQAVFPIKEDATTCPVNHYGSLKLCSETILRTYAIQQSADIIIARIANVYGPGQQYERGVGFVDAVIRNALEKKPVVVFGNGDIVRDYIYVGDACKMLIQLLRYQGEYKVFNVSTGVGTSQKQIMNIVSSIVDSVEVSYQPVRKVDVKNIVLDNSRIKQLYRESITSIESGIKICIQSFM